MLKRIVDVSGSLAGLVVLAPLFAVIGAAIVIDDGFPVFFRQTRVGRNGRLFTIIKFRSMHAGRSGAQITASTDRRISRVGRILRKLKLDELPQLWNVLKGDMSLVGPRPEVPCFVQLNSPVWQQVLSVRPGITEFASLVFYGEEALLASAPDPEAYYRENVLPAKLALNLRYVGTQSFLLDMKLILVTVFWAVIGRRPLLREHA
jgi:lipopolysaccharide/colanic/teichoic acid biosynthesis glycosyltransferase